ncbi:KH domain [Popillia japonica]|uniref:KH domain n=1 Tax=Popillia japonica TaxID=7064 RepID=A0AAW1IZA6_POPJA
MKREADGDMGAPQKKTRRGDEELRLLIPSKVAGSIIGKGGQNITKLRSQYKASITVPDCPGPERMLTLSSDLESICSIVNDVVPNLEENGSRINGGELDLRMMIHQSQAGCVIGKGGSKIKEIRDKTGARIKIFSNWAPQSTDRIIQIVGEPAKCIDTIREVITLIKTNPIKGPVSPYDPHNYDDYYAEEYGGYGNSGNDRRGGGQRGGNGPRDRDGGGRFQSNNRGPQSSQRGPMGGGFHDRGMGGPTSSRGNFNGPPRGMNGGGPFDNQRNNGWGSGPMNGGSSSSLMNQGPMMGGGGGMNMGGGNNQGNGMSPNKSTTQVTIPKDLAGAIIGKGGGRIRKIRQDSGAGITIDEPLPGSNDRIITISGLPNQIQMAQYLLQQSVHNNAERNSY